MLYQITSSYFCAGIYIIGEKCTEAAPILRWCIGKHKNYLFDYFRKKDWSWTKIS